MSEHYYRPHFHQQHRKVTPLTTAVRIEREERRLLEAQIIQAAEDIYPSEGAAAISTHCDVDGVAGAVADGWSVTVVLGDHYLRLTGLRTERLALIAAREKLRAQLKWLRRSGR